MFSGLQEERGSGCYSHRRKREKGETVMSQNKAGKEKLYGP